jgi:threonine dehydratase
LKCEHLQKTGSFKVRGMLNHMASLTETAHACGVITISAGNAAAAVAWAARQAGIPCTVVMPAAANRTKVAASEAYGAEVVLHGTGAEAFELVHELADRHGFHFVHPFDDAHVVAGHGTCALEIAEQVENVATLVVPVGGGGLAAGIALGASEVLPDVDVWCVEPDGASAMQQSFECGRAVHLDSVGTIADGLAAPMAGELTYRILRERAAGCLTIPDDAIRHAMSFLMQRTKQVVEPGGAAGVAALLEGLVPGEGPAVAILSGGNVDLSMLDDLVGHGVG